MAADMMENEMADLHRELDETEGTRSCKAHQAAVVPSLKKLLRICEAMHKNQKYFMFILLSILVSIWAKGTPATDIADNILRVLVASATGGTP